MTSGWFSVLHLSDVHGHLRRDSDLVEIGRLPYGELRLHGSTSSLRFREGEDDHRAAVAGAEHAGEEPLGPPAPADRHGDVLPAVDAVGRRAAVVTTAALELPQQLPAAGVER